MASGTNPSRLRRNAIANMVGRGPSMLLWIAVTPFALRHLGQERFAIWTLFFTLSGYAIALDFGAGAGVARFVAVATARRDRSEVRRLILRSLAISCGLGILWAMACVLGREAFVQVFNVPPDWAHEVRASLLVFSLSLLLSSFSQVLLGALIGFQRLDLWNLYFLTGLAAHLGLLVIGLARGYGLVGAAAAAAIGHAVTVALAARSVRAGLRNVEQGVTGESFSWRDLLGYGVQIQGATFFGIGQWQAGKVLLGAIGRLAWVTQFELAFRVTNALWSVSSLIQGAVVPAMAHAAEAGGMEEARRLYEWCCRWVILVGGFAIGLVGTTAPALFTLWLGGSHPETVVTARWIAVGLGFSALAGPSTAISRGLGFPWFEALNFAIALVVNVLVSLALIPRLGASGAGIAMAVSFLVATVCLVPLFHRRIGVATGPWLARIAAPRMAPAAIIATGLGLVMDRWGLDSRTEAFVAVAVGGSLYTLLFTASTWPTGDLRALIAKGREWLRRRRPAGAGGAGVA